MTPQKHLITDPAKEIIRHLEPITASGYGSYQVFQDFLDITHATLEALPSHVRAAVKKEPLTDTPATAELFTRMQERYKQQHWERFQRAFAVLLASTDEYQDVLGPTFEAFGSPNTKAGQFFTPWSISVMMAKMIMGDVEKQVHERIKEAVLDNPLAQAVLIAGMVVTEPAEAEKYFFQRFLPVVAPSVKPLTVCDPACGSAGMLLAGASCCPRWVLDYGLVQFYGMDIDARCVKMAQINMMLYGLNGYSIKCALALEGAELAAVPEPWQQKYKDAQAADRAGDQAAVEEIRKEVGTWKQNSLF